MTRNTWTRFTTRIMSKNMWTRYIIGTRFITRGTIRYWYVFFYKVTIVINITRGSCLGIVFIEKVIRTCNFNKINWNSFNTNKMNAIYKGTGN